LTEPAYVNSFGVRVKAPVAAPGPCGTIGSWHGRLRLHSPSRPSSRWRTTRVALSPNSPRLRAARRAGRASRPPRAPRGLRRRRGRRRRPRHYRRTGACQAWPGSSSTRSPSARTSTLTGT